MMATFGGRQGSGRGPEEGFCAILAKVFVSNKSLSSMVLFLPSTPLFCICVVFQDKKGKQRMGGENWRKSASNSLEEYCYKKTKVGVGGRPKRVVAGRKMK